MEIIENWIEELESGKYGQAYSRLKRDETTYCCLGVLCEVSSMGTWEINSDTQVAAYLGETGTLPSMVMKQAGLTTSIGEFIATKEWYKSLSERAQEKIRKVLIVYDLPQRSSLVTLNDSKIPFDVIAEVIKSRPKGLFQEK